MLCHTSKHKNQMWATIETGYEHRPYFVLSLWFIHIYIYIFIYFQLMCSMPHFFSSFHSFFMLHFKSVGGAKNASPARNLECDYWMSHLSASSLFVDAETHEEFAALFFFFFPPCQPSQDRRSNIERIFNHALRFGENDDNIERNVKWNGEDGVFFGGTLEL